MAFSPVIPLIVKPNLQYATEVWDAYIQDLVDSIERVQRHEARFIKGDYNKNSVYGNAAITGFRQILCCLGEKLIG